MTHEMKITQTDYDLKMKGCKSWEHRRITADYVVGDKMCLKVYDYKGGYKGIDMTVAILFIQYLGDGYVIMSDDSALRGAQ